MITKQRAEVRCVLCGRTGSRTLLDGAVRRCGWCGLAWTAAAPTPPAQLYDESYFRGGAYRDYFDARQRRFEAARRLRWLYSAARPATLLEAGSAGGFFLAAARGAGIAATGIEVSQVAVRYAREHLDVSVHCGLFEELARSVPPVEAVCAFHVLEHVTDPRAFLAAARDALVPGGLLALEVPNIAAAAARRLGPAWPAWDLRHHNWHFTPDSLSRLLITNGFRVASYDTVFSRFYWRPLARLAHTRELLIADLAASRSPSVRHRHLGDLLRVVARRTGAAGPR
ncbi:MAG TPA: class I SAM-dependent methyltransferase [Rugosimonospora sp.]|nr:class I SAM-dependent methyltransferase [Rugosimonospora sp.]